MNETIRALFSRKSTRVFEDRPIPSDAKQVIIESALQAPTAGNQLLYTIIDVTDKKLLKGLSLTCDDQPFIAQAKMALVFVADCQRWLDMYRLAGKNPREPGVGDLMLAVSDACIAAQNTIVCAQSLGIGSCYIGDILESAELHRDVLHLPEFTMPCAMVVFGYPTVQQQRKKPARFPTKYIVHENAYRQLSPDEIHDMYHSREAAEGRDRAFEPTIRSFCERKYESDFAREMTRSVEVYLKSFLRK